MILKTTWSHHSWRYWTYPRPLVLIRMCLLKLFICILIGRYDSKLRSELGGNTWQMVQQPQPLCIFGNIVAYLDEIIFKILYLKQHLWQYCCILGCDNISLIIIKAISFWIFGNIAAYLAAIIFLKLYLNQHLLHIWQYCCMYTVCILYVYLDAIIFLKLYLKQHLRQYCCMYVDAIIFQKLYLKQHLWQYCCILGCNNINLLRILFLKLYLKGPPNSSAVTKVRWRGRRRSAARTCIIFLSFHSSQFSRWKFFAHCCIIRPTTIVGKKRDPGILDPELFLAQIRKVEARFGKLAKIRKSVIN